MMKNWHFILELSETFFRKSFRADLRSLALLRILTALILFWDLILRSFYFFEFYSEESILPLKALAKIALPLEFTLYSLSTNIYYSLALYVATILASIILFLGYKTKIISVICWVLLLSLYNRNPLVNSSADKILLLILFWGMFLPWEKRYSFDAFFNKGLSNIKNTLVTFSTFAYFFQVFIIYFFSALSKSGDPWRVNGDAIYYVLSSYVFTTPTGAFFLEFFSKELLKLLTFTVPFFEFFGSLILIFSVSERLRLLIIFLFILMHIVFGASLRIGIFSPVIIIALVGLLPAYFWEKVNYLREKMRTNPLTLYYDKECGLCLMVVRALRIILFNPKLKVLSADKQILASMQKLDSWVVLDSKGRRYFKFDAFIVLLESSMIFWIFGKVLRFPIFRKFGYLVYTFMSKNRKKICRLPSMQKSKENRGLEIVINTSITLTIVYIFLWNISTLQGSQLKFNEDLKSFGYFFRLGQRWNMFAPSPFKTNFSFNITGQTRQGEIIDLTDYSPGIITTNPKLGTNPFESSRWGKYYSNLAYKNRDQIHFYSQYICGKWIRNNSSKSPLRSIHTVLETWQITDKPPTKKDNIYFDTSCLLSKDVFN